MHKSVPIYTVLCSIVSNVWAFTAQQYALLFVLCIIMSSSHHTSKIWLLRWNLHKSKKKVQYLVCLLDAQNMLIFQKFTLYWWRWTKCWGLMTLDPNCTFKENLFLYPSGFLLWIGHCNLMHEVLCGLHCVCKWWSCLWEILSWGFQS